MKRLIISEIPPDFNPDKDILLGPFCLVGHEKEFSDWESYIIEPDPFGTVVQTKNATEYTAQYANSLLPYLKNELNKLNNLNNSIEFWRILIYPWLVSHVQVLWERYLRVKNIIDKYSDQQLEIQIISNKYRWCFQNTLDYYYNGVQNIHYNEWILSRLIEDNKPSSWSLKYVDKKPTKQPLPKQSWKRTLYDKYFSSLRCKDVIGINPIESTILSFILSFNKKNQNDTPKKNSIRKETNNHSAEEINRKIFIYILKDLPECFKKINLLNHPKPAPRKGKKRIVGPFGLYFNENSKKYLAHNIIKGEKIIPTQHGNYGTHLFHTLPGEVEYFHDSFLTWGWSQYSEYKCNFIGMSSPFLSKFANRHKKKNDHLIFVGTEINIISSGIGSVQPLQNFLYINEKKSFIKNLKNTIFKNLLYRPYYRKYGTIDEGKLIENAFPNIILFQDNLQGKLHKSILGCKLLILDHPGTTLNIAMAANIPTICYWDEKHFPLCEQVKPFFNTFKKAGILFNSGHDAASKVNEIWNDVDLWWAQKDIQEARQKFCWNYARTSKFWFFEWIKMIVSL